MTRRALLLSSVFAASCTKTADFRFPERAGAWTRSGEPSPAAAPKEAHRAWQATYAGPFPVQVTVAEMLSGSNAFAAVQSWRSEPGKMPFFRQQYFGVAEAPGASGRDLAAFVQAFEEAVAK